MDLTPAEVELEKKLDEERFRDLISDEVADAHGMHAHCPLDRRSHLTHLQRKR